MGRTSAIPSRIVGHGDEDPSQLLANPLNFRRHPGRQLDALRGSLKELGWVKTVIVNRTTGHVLDGHARVEEAMRQHQPTVPVSYVELSPDEERLALAVLDPITELAIRDDDALQALLADVTTDDPGLLAMLAEMKGENPPAGLLPGADEDAVPEPPEEPKTKPGDLYVLGAHRLLCGDSTVVTDVERLMGADRATLLHADPPYGMGKEADGVTNDNLYAEKLDKFQMEWWATFRTFLAANASAYVWGNAPDLWRWWYAGGLAASERLELRNEIVWDKRNIAGMASPELTQYPVASERCLFFQFGQQFRGNVNADDFPESWEPLRSHLAGEAQAAGVGSGDVRRICGCAMYGHWFSRSQFTLIPEKHYAALGAGYPGRFTRPWRELRAEWERVKGGPTSEIQGARSFFDNAHDSMRDVWEFPRVTGSDRHGHATPKPVALVERAIRSSSREGDTVIEPFGGSGSTLIACEKTGRAARLMEIEPRWCDVIVRRWEDATGKQAVLEERAA